MFGHLKAEDFVDVIEGTEGDLQTKRRLHLNACAQCTETLAAAQSLHAELTKSVLAETAETIDPEIPEPDWFQFRTGVRNTMLSRAARRQAGTGFWSGWLRPALQPAVSWGLAVAFAAGLSAGILIWNHHGTIPVSSEGAGLETSGSSDAEPVANLEADDALVIPVDVSASPQTSIFEELAQLDDMQSEKLQQLLEADAEQAPASPLQVPVQQ